MLYCTGGIRCVKVGAYLKQTKGFHNVTRLQVHPTPYTLHPTPFTLHPTPYTLHPTPYTLHPIPHTLQGGIVAYVGDMQAALVPSRYPTPGTRTPKPGTWTLKPATSKGSKSPGLIKPYNIRGNAKDSKIQLLMTTHNIQGSDFEKGSKFQGLNYVFDGRVGQVVTPQVLSLELTEF